MILGELTDADTAVLAAIFQSRYELRTQSQDVAIQQAAKEWQETIAWFESNSTARGSFLWFCDELDLNPAAVREQIVHAQRLSANR